MATQELKLNLTDKQQNQSNLCINVNNIWKNNNSIKLQLKLFRFLRIHSLRLLLLRLFLLLLLLRTVLIPKRQQQTTLIPRN